MDTVVKALLYIGTVLTLGAGIFAWFIGPELTQGRVRRWLRWGLAIGAVSILLLSPLQIVVTLSSLLGRFDLSIGREYLLTTRHGTATLLRLGALVLVVTATLLPVRRTAGRLLFAGSALLLLGSFSWTSHAVSIGGILPLLGDLLHFTAGASWAGAVLYAAWLPIWGTTPLRDGIVRAVGRVSTTGLTSVLLLSLSGLYTALLHVRTPELLTSSPYGRVLTAKNLLVLVIIGIAAVNRWWFLPRLHALKPSPSFVRLFRGEAILLLVVLALTGLLTTSALPHAPGVPSNPLENLRNFIPD